jgi:PAS domain S-box-containing protein
MLSPQLISNALHSAPDAMVIVDRTGRIVFSNRQVCALFGYDPAELTGQQVECLLPERFRTGHIGHRAAYSENVRVRPMGSGLDLFARRKDGTEFPVEISLSPASDATDSFIVAAIRDTTDRRRTQTELREAREAADRANRAKSRFLAMASHDLRQPVQTLALLNGTMRRMSPSPDFAEVLQQEYEAIETMSRLLSSLLDISKLESGAIKPEIGEFSVADLFDQLRREFFSLAAAKGLQLEAEKCAYSVRSDPTLVGQVIRNFISNAIKYTEQGWVRLRCLHEDSCLRLQVADSGIGIPPDALPHIFDDFYQVGVPSNTTREGYGLGLGIVSRIAHLLGAELGVQSEPGRGTVVSIALPVGAGVESRDRRMVGEPSVSAAARHAHILLVDDDARVRNATRSLLRIEDYMVHSAETYAEALEHAAAHPEIQLLITDYHLGGGETGLQVVESVRARLGAELPAVLITGDTSLAIRELPAERRLRTVSKPVNPDELLKLIRELLPM